jgi:hypothetical protein
MGKSKTEIKKNTYRERGKKQAVGRAYLIKGINPCYKILCAMPIGRINCTGEKSKK